MPFFRLLCFCCFYLQVIFMPFSRSHFLPYYCTSLCFVVLLFFREFSPARFLFCIIYRKTLPLVALTSPEVANFKFNFKMWQCRRCSLTCWKVGWKIVVGTGGTMYTFIARCRSVDYLKKNTHKHTCNVQFSFSSKYRKKNEREYGKKTPLANFLPFHALASYASDKSY